MVTSYGVCFSVEVSISFDGSKLGCTQSFPRALADAPRRVPFVSRFGLEFCIFHVDSLL